LPLAHHEGAARGAASPECAAGARPHHVVAAAELAGQREAPGRRPIRLDEVPVGALGRGPEGAIAVREAAAAPTHSLRDGDTYALDPPEAAGNVSGSTDGHMAVAHDDVGHARARRVAHRAAPSKGSVG